MTTNIILAAAKRLRGEAIFAFYTKSEAWKYLGEFGADISNDDRKMIPDPNISKPENWNDEEDGEFSAPMIFDPRDSDYPALVMSLPPELEGWRKIQLPPGGVKFVFDDLVDRLGRKAYLNSKAKENLVVRWVRGVTAGAEVPYLRSLKDDGSEWKPGKVLRLVTDTIRKSLFERDDSDDTLLAMFNAQSSEYERAITRGAIHEIAALVKNIKGVKVAAIDIGAHANELDPDWFPEISEFLTGVKPMKAFLLRSGRSAIPYNESEYTYEQPKADGDGPVDAESLQLSIHRQKILAFLDKHSATVKKGKAYMQNMAFKIAAQAKDERDQYTQRDAALIGLEKLNLDGRGRVLKQVYRGGKGSMPAPGDGVGVHYIAYHLNGTKFASTRLKGSEPVHLKLQAGSAIPCWLLALNSMKVGERIMLTCDPEAAFGALGDPPVIPPNATLVYDIELMYIKQAASAADKPTQTRKEL